MALAFKRAQKGVEEAMEEFQKYMESYGPGRIPVEIDYDGIKKIEGKTNKWTNSEEKPKNEIGVLYLQEKGFADLKYLITSYICKDDIGKEIFKNAVQKITIAVDDKAKPGSYNEHNFKFNGTTLEWVAHLDYSNYVCQNMNYDACTAQILKVLNDQHNISFERAKKEFEDGKSWNQDRYKGSFSQELDFDWEGMKNYKGWTDKFSYQKENPKNEVMVHYIKDQMFLGVIMALEQVAKDDLGKEAINEMYKKFVFHVDDTGKKGTYGHHDVKKQGDELHFTAHLDFSQYTGQNYPYDAVAKQIEATLG